MPRNRGARSAVNIFILLHQAQPQQNPLPPAAAVHIRRRANRYQIGEKVVTDWITLRELLHQEFPGHPIPRICPPVIYQNAKNRLLTNTVDRGKMLSAFMKYMIRYQNGMMEYV